MKSGRVFLDSFSGAAADLPRGKRSPAAVLAALRINPRVSTFDMSEHAWLCDCISSLKADHLITEDQTEPYPWHRFSVVEPDPSCTRPARTVIDAARSTPAKGGEHDPQ